MKNILILVFINLMLVLFQDSFLANLLTFDFVPTLLLALSFGFILSDKEDLSYKSAFIGGLLSDFLDFRIVGESSLILVVCLFLFSLFRRYVSKNIISNFVGVFVVNSIFLFLTASVSSISIYNYITNGILTFLTSVIFYFFIQSLTASSMKNVYTVQR
ncbi:hypothetical protein HYV31_00135 [candidate division WWE3 bacterium]|nr:hypothetical protein [candidate division WWE3 bacterium]